MTSPLMLPVGAVLRSGAPETLTRTGWAPERIGLELIGIEAGAEVEVSATVTSLGGGVLVDATLTGPVTGTCARCLTPLSAERSFHVNEVFAATEDFITGEAAEDDEDEIARVVDDTVDLLQSIIDEAGVTLPFSPTCEFVGRQCSHREVPAPSEASDVDPRWQGLADRFKELS